MSTCLLSIVIDVEKDLPRLYQVLCLNPRLVVDPCYHDGILSPGIPSPPATPSSPHMGSPTYAGSETTLFPPPGRKSGHATKNSFPVPLKLVNDLNNPDNNQPYPEIQNDESEFKTIADSSERSNAPLLNRGCWKNVEFVFEDVLEYWKSLDYVKVCSASYLWCVTASLVSISLKLSPSSFSIEE